MAMNGIDIASYQTGIDLTVVPCDFVIVKATEGTGYVNPDFTRAYAQAKKQFSALTGRGRTTRHSVAQILHGARAGLTTYTRKQA